ncbi:hypothetical protein [Dokdonella soli]|uniref:DUF2946 domain-containing protein n=1 Tax=Dokdonella soli TaxID=529810 RepID=A0ABP3U1J0_9GAMM
MLFRRRRHRRLIALIALLGLLFQQLAMAGYMCPLEQSGATVAVSKPTCHEQGAADPRCHEHCHPQTPSSDHPPVPSVPAALFPPTTWLRDAAWFVADTRVHHRGEIVARAAAPPLTIRHCTFQI